MALALPTWQLHVICGLLTAKDRWVEKLHRTINEASAAAGAIAATDWHARCLS
jgi:hypothetical protein